MLLCTIVILYSYKDAYYLLTVAVLRQKMMAVLHHTCHDDFECDLDASVSGGTFANKMIVLEE